MTSPIIYLDNAATTPLDPLVLEAMMPYYKHDYGNPSTHHQLGSRSKVAIEGARRSMANILCAEKGHIFFTSGGTEGNNWALRGLITANNITCVITSPIEHRSVLAPLQHLAQQDQITLHYLPLDPQGHVAHNALGDLLAHHPNALVSLMHGNNEIGNLTDIAHVGALCRQHGALFHTDMVQTISQIPIDLDNLPIDICTASAHKFHGPKGIGFIYLRNGVKIAPLIHGGAQEKEMRAGTENVAAIVGMSKALSIAHQHRAANYQHLQRLKKRLIQKITEDVPEACFHGASADVTGSLPSILSVGFPWQHYQDTMIFKLDIDGINASAGSACMSGIQPISHVLKAIEAPYPQSSVRFSFSKYNTLEEIIAVAKKIATY